MTISSVDVNSNLIWKAEVNENFCYGLSRQMYNWELSHVNSLRNVWGFVFWQHTNFTGPVVRAAWSIKPSKSAVFFKILLCENKRKRTSVSIPTMFSNVLVWAKRRRRAMETSWHVRKVYPILAARRYLQQSRNLSELTTLNRKSNFKTCVAQNIPLTSNKSLNFQLIFNYCKIEACFDA